MTRSPFAATRFREGPCCGPAWLLVPAWPSASLRWLRNPDRDARTRRTASLALNRSLVSLDNKLNQFDAALTVQRAVRQALTEIDQHLQAAAGAGRPVRARRADAVVRAPAPGIRYSDGSPVQVAGRRHRAEDVQRGRRLLRRRVLSGVAHRRADRRDQLHAQHRTPGPGARLPDVEHPHHPGGGQRARGTAVRCRDRAVRRDRKQPRRRHTTRWRATTSTGARAPHVESVAFGSCPTSPTASWRCAAARSMSSTPSPPTPPISSPGLTGVAIDRADGVRLNQLFYNFRKPPGHPLADPRVRRALTYAIDGSVTDRRCDAGLGHRVARRHPHDPRRRDRDRRVHLRPRPCPRRARCAGRPRPAMLKIIWERGEFAADTDIMESVVADARRRRRADPTAAVRARRRHLDMASGQGRRLGRARQRLPKPHRPCADDHAGHVRRHRREGSDPRHLPRLRFSRDHRGHHQGIRGTRPGPSRPLLADAQRQDLGYLPDDVVVRAEGRAGPARPHRRRRVAPDQFLRPQRRRVR